MAKPVREFSTPWLKGDSMTELENRASIPPPEINQINDDKVRADIKPEGSDPSEKPEAQETLRQNTQTLSFPELGLWRGAWCTGMCM